MNSGSINPNLQNNSHAEMNTNRETILMVNAFAVLSTFMACPPMVGRRAFSDPPVRYE